MTERYARLMQFEFADFSKLKDVRAMIVGVGGLGALSAEIMARVGIGELVLMDYDTLEEANLNRLIYNADQIGMPKVDALKEHLLKANPEVAITTYPYDITDGKGYDSFLDEVGKCDIVLGCVDTFPVRLFINTQVVKAGKPLIDGGASNDGINGSVHVVIPGKTACYRCNRPVVEEPSEYKPKSDGSGLCHFTSLPTTMAIISSLQCQEGLKHLLGFGKVASYLMYYGMEGRLERYDWERDPNCPVCGKV
ncbi:MAG: HesA/MoeB/ThiF family protein [Thermoplasmata archaeon]|nr:HesA/MoeB/ThiF family protein [Thermoplasmata archaeon]